MLVAAVVAVVLIIPLAVTAPVIPVAPPTLITPESDITPLVSIENRDADDVRSIISNTPVLEERISNNLPDAPVFCNSIFVELLALIARMHESSPARF